MGSPSHRRMIVMKRLLILLLLCLPAAAMAGTWHVEPASSSLGFDGSFQGQAFHGRFKQFSATIDYDPDDLATARFDVTVNLASVDTQSAARDQALTGSDFFAVSQYPQAHFVTRSFSRNADGRVVAHGTLTMRGISQPVDLDVDFRPSANGATLDVTTTVPRLAFKLGASDDWAGISKKIKVHGHLVLSKAS